MFADMDLIGIPHRLVIGDRGLRNGTIEHKVRRDAGTNELPLDETVERLRELVKNK